MRLLFILTLLTLISSPAFAEGTPKESAYDRVMRTKTLRCGYFPWPPYLSKDPNTGGLHGFYFDYVESLAKHLGIKVDWTSEVLYGLVPEEIRSGKIDAFCSGIWPTSGLALYLDFSLPISYNAVGAYVRVDDNRFDGDLSRLNDASIKISSMEGSITGVIASLRFPNSVVSETPAMSGPSAQLMDVMAKKADATFIDILIVREFEKSNPNKIRPVANVPPVNVWGNSIAFGKHEEPLVNAINTATQEMIYSGEIEMILKKYAEGTKEFYQVVLPYKAEK
jgi:ABC-type amino acid transport substrate-binding protein